jgi:hypothetical protein
MVGAGVTQRVVPKRNRYALSVRRALAVWCRSEMLCARSLDFQSRCIGAVEWALAVWRCTDNFETTLRSSSSSYSSSSMLCFLLLTRPLPPSSSPCHPCSCLNSGEFEFHSGQPCPGCSVLWSSHTGPRPPWLFPPLQRPVMPSLAISRGGPAFETSAWQARGDHLLGSGLYFDVARRSAQSQCGLVSVRAWSQDRMWSLVYLRSFY